MNKLTVSGTMALLGWALLAPQSARAQSASDKATAEALFSEGRRLMSQSNYHDACPKFEASLRLDRGLGAMLNLADCYEKNGQTASAWAEFREASAAARAAGSRDREDLARQRAGALEPKLSRLTIAVARPPAQVTRDGTAVDSAVFGTSVPVDPGKHVIEATAPGKQKWAKTVDVGASGARVSVEVPPLQDDPQAGAGTTQPPVPPPPGGGVDVAAGTSSPQRTIAIAVGAVGVAGIAAGAFFGLKASSTWKTAKEGCTNYPNGCSPDAAESSQDAGSQATIATVGFVIGAAALAGGAVLWFTAPHAPESETKVSFGVGPTGVVVRGGF
jgi:hypothetical protein